MKLLKNLLLKILSFLIWIYANVLSVAYIFTAVLIRGRALPTEVTERLTKALCVKVAVTPSSKPLCDVAEMIVLCNHRSWADFMVDSALTGGGTYLSRMLVAVGVPGPAFFGWVTGAVAFFERGKKVEKGGVKRDSVWWTEYFRNHWANVRPGAPVIVYPEGTRNQKMESLPLKMGCLKVAHTLGVPVQVVITTEKEKIFNEKAGSVALGVRCVVSVSPALKPKDFASLEDFIAAVQAAWEAAWTDAYACSLEKATLLPHSMLLPGGVPRYTAVNARRLLFVRAFAFAAAAAIAARWVL